MPVFVRSHVAHTSVSFGPRGIVASRSTGPVSSPGSMMLSNTKSLLVVTAVVELVAGIVLLITPSLASKLLLGAGLGSPESVLVGKIGGAALLAIGLSCWLSRNHDRDGQAIGLVAGLLVYNAAIVVLLLYAGVVDKMHGVGIWPTIGLHSALSIWCVARLRRGSQASSGSRSDAAS